MKRDNGPDDLTMTLEEMAKMAAQIVEALGGDPEPEDPSPRRAWLERAGAKPRKS